jgi:putative ABC transport system substrate-binding protein
MNCGNNMTSRIAWLLGLLLYLAACATFDDEGGPAPAKLTPVVIVDPPTRPGAPTLLLAMPTSPNFVEVRKGLLSEVQKNFNVSTFAVGPETKATDLAAAIEATKPACVVLMNNTTIALYRQVQAAAPTAPMPPAILMMASFLEEVQTHIRRSTGIAYEVPGVTAFVHLRSVITTPINRVGVIYRPAFGKFVERQKVLAAKENVEIVPLSVANDVTAAGLRDAIHKLAKDKKVDAIWMLNDNALVRDQEFIDEAWRAETADAKLPLIVGVSNFVEPNSPLGTLAIVPDHEALGLQAANLIFDLSDNGWQVESHAVELPLSVRTVVDVKLVQANFGLQTDALKHIDKALE